MKRIVLAGLLCVLGSCASTPLFAQTNPNAEAGLKPYGSYDANDFDTVSLTNLNLFVHIPLIGYPQRGSLVWQTYVVYNGKNFYTAVTCNSHTDTCTARWVWGNQRVAGTPGVYLINRDAVNVHYQFVSPNNWATVYTWDGSGHEMAHLSGGTQSPFDGSGFGIDTSSYVQNSHGDRIGTEDTNGNLFSLGTNSVQDTMARSLPVGGTTTTDYTGCTGPLTTTSATITSYPGYNAGSAQVKLCYASGVLKTAFNVRITDQYGNRDLVTEFSGTTQFLQTVIVYNGSSWASSPEWSFTFDAGAPGDTNVHYGDLLSVTLPTGGTISYTWATTGTCGSQLSPTSRGVTSRTVNANDGLGPQKTSYSAAAPGLVQTDPMAMIRSMLSLG